MSEERGHSYIPKLKEQFADGRINRREFLRYSTLLGMSATAAYVCVGKVTGQNFAVPAKAGMPRGGSLRISMRVQEVTSPHTYNWIAPSNVGRQVHEYLTRTGQDNIARPHLAENWSASDDLKTWTLSLRKVKWHNGRDFTADDALWNLNRCLDEATGSSVVGLMKGYMLNETADGKTELWDANALEKVDDHTIRLNLKQPQVAVPEHLFHYPLAMLDPEEGGAFGVGSNGTGPFDLVAHRVGEKSILKARSDYWGEGPHLDELQFLDLGDDPSAAIDAMRSRQVHGIYEGDVSQLDVFKAMPHVTVYEALTAATAVARVQVDVEAYSDPRVRKAMRLAVDTRRCLELAHRGFGAPGEHHHVCPVHPDYEKLPFMARDVEAAKQLLAEAGHPNGVSFEIAVKKDPAWEIQAVQAMVEQWKDAGIRVDINLMPSAQFWEVWDKVPFGFTQWAHLPLGFMVLALGYRSGVPWNESHYANPEFDALLTKAEGMLDIDERREILGQIEQIMQEDGPIVQPLWRALFVGYDKRVRGFQPHPTGYIFGEQLGIES